MDKRKQAMNNKLSIAFFLKEILKDKNFVYETFAHNVFL